MENWSKSISTSFVIQFLRVKFVGNQSYNLKTHWVIILDGNQMALIPRNGSDLNCSLQFAVEPNNTVRPFSKIFFML